MLGQNFARAAGIEFLDRDNVRKHPWGTSWGFSTRMVGATIMAHGDDSGLVLPPNVAPTQVAIVPIFRSEDDRSAVEAALGPLEAALKDVTTASGPLRVKVDRREESPGFKYNHWELRGVPFRLEVGPRDVAAGQGVLVRRVDRAKEPIALDALAADLPGRLAAYQQALFQRALDFREANTHRLDTLDDLKSLDGRGGRLRARSVVRRCRLRAARQRGDRRHHPGHPVRLARRARHVPGRRPTLRSPGALRSSLLATGRGTRSGSSGPGRLARRPPPARTRPEPVHIPTGVVPEQMPPCCAPSGTAILAASVLRHARIRATGTAGEPHERRERRRVPPGLVGDHIRGGSRPRRRLTGRDMVNRGSRAR